MATWTALLSSWANKAISIARMNAYFSTSGNMQYLKDHVSALEIGRQILGAGNLQKIHDTSVETDLISHEVTAGALGTAGSLDCELAYILYNASGGDVTYTLKFYYGASSITIRSGIVSTASTIYGTVRAVLSNNNSANSQLVQFFGSEDGSVINGSSSFSISSGSAQTAKFTGTMSVADEGADIAQMIGVIGINVAG